MKITQKDRLIKRVKLLSSSTRPGSLYRNTLNESLYLCISANTQVYPECILVDIEHGTMHRCVDNDWGGRFVRVDSNLEWGYPT
jgi:hypothetical protein